MLTHHLTFVQLKHTFVSNKGAIVQVDAGLHPDDAVAAGFFPIIAATISVEGLGFHFQRLYTSDALPVSTFLYEAWKEFEISFGVPDNLVIDENINGSVDIKNLLSQVCIEPPNVLVRNDKKYQGSKRSAQSVYFYATLKRHVNLTSLDPITADDYHLKMDRERKARSTPERRALVGALKDRVPIEPVRPRQLVTMDVEEWMRKGAMSTPLLESFKRLIKYEVRRGIERYVIGLKPEDFESDPNWLNGRRQVFMTQCEPLMRCLWAGNIKCYYELEDILYIDEFREILWDRMPINVEMYDLIQQYFIDCVSFLDPGRVQDIKYILSFMGAKPLRRAELKTPRAESSVFQHRFLVYEVEIQNLEKLIVFTIDEYNIEDDDGSLGELQLIDVEYTNSELFVKLMRDVMIGNVDPGIVLHELQEGLNDSAAWSYLGNGDSRFDVMPKAETPRSGSITGLHLNIERWLLIAALQALHRERVLAYNTVFDACKQTGARMPESTLFGIEEVARLLRNLGAAPD